MVTSTMENVISSIIPSIPPSCLLLMALTISFVDPIIGDDIENSDVIVHKEAGTLFHDYHQHQFTEITLPLERVSILSNVFLVELVITYLALIYRYVLTPKREIVDLKIGQNGNIRYKKHEDADTLQRAISDQFWSDPMNYERLSLCSMGTTNFEEEYCGFDQYFKKCGENDDDSFMTTLPGDGVHRRELNDLQEPEDRWRCIQRNYVRKERYRAQQKREEQESIDEEEDEVRGQKEQIQNKSKKESKKGIYKMGREAATENSSGNRGTKSVSIDRSRGIVNEPTSKKKLMGNTNGQDDSRQKQEQQQKEQTQENSNVTKNGSNQLIHEMQSICTRNVPRSIKGKQTIREWVTFTDAETSQNGNNQNNADHQTATKQQGVGSTKERFRAQQKRKEQESIDEEEDEVRGQKEDKIQNQLAKAIKKGVQKEPPAAATENSLETAATNSLSMDRSRGIVNGSTSQLGHARSTQKQLEQKEMKSVATKSMKLIQNAHCQDHGRQQRTKENGSGTRDGSNQSMHQMQAICVPDALQLVGGKQTNRERKTFAFGETLKPQNDPKSTKQQESETTNGWINTVQSHNASVRPSLTSPKKCLDTLSIDIPTDDEEPSQQQSEVNAYWIECDAAPNGQHNASILCETTNGWSSTVHSHYTSARSSLNPPMNWLNALSIDIPMDDVTPSQQQSEVNPHWKQLADPPLGFTTAIIGIDDSEYLRTSTTAIIGDNSATDSTTLVRFNVKRNEWESHIVVPHLDLHTVYGFDTHSKLVYAENQNGNIVGVESESGKWEISKFGNISTLEMRFGFMINGNLHLLHSLVSDVDHIIIDQNGDQTTEQIGDEWNVMSICNAVHSEPRQSIIIFGLSYERIPLFGEYSVTTNHWKTWTWPTADSLDIAHCERAGMLCTADGRYLMFFGGVGDTTAKEQWAQSDRITVCDLKDHTAKPFVSAMRCPQRKTFTAFLMEGSGSWEYLAVSGYLRKCYDDLKLEKTKTLPHVLVELIMQRISRGYIHLVEKSIGEGHWRISANDVMHSDDSCSRTN